MSTLRKIILALLLTTFLVAGLGILVVAGITYPPLGFSMVALGVLSFLVFCIYSCLD